MLITIIKKYKNLLTKREKKLLAGLVFFSFFVSIVEMIGVSAVMPFISLITDPEQISTNHYYSFFYRTLHFDTATTFILAFGSCLVVFYITRSIINCIYFYSMAKFVHGQYFSTVMKLVRNYMYFNYEEFTKRNSSDLSKTIISEAQYLSHVLSAILLLFSEISLVLLMYIMLLYVNVKVTLILTAILVVAVIVMLLTISQKIKGAGIQRAVIQKDFYEIINRSFGNFKFIKLVCSEDSILKEFGDTSYKFSQANCRTESLAPMPRLVLEGLGFSLLILITMVLVWQDTSSLTSSLSAISIFVLALYRLMPSVNRLSTSYNMIAFAHKAVDIIDYELKNDGENIGDEPIHFDSKIQLNQVDFSYSGSPNKILNNVSLEINKGDWVGFIGESGAGKSTLVDIIIGLNRVCEGIMLIDNQVLLDNNLASWRKKIGYIPQNVYLFDGTVGENVAFGHEYNEVKIKQALTAAKLWDFFDKKEGIHTIVGENGLMVSGGQKQRVAIARAIYGEPEILVMDEATSALDADTEREIMQSIYELGTDKTLLIIAHRLSTLSRCNTIFEVKKGVVRGAEISNE